MADLAELLQGLDPSALTVKEQKELIKLLETRQRLLDENRLARYEPYPKQMEFHAAGKDNRERLLMAGSQLGKTYSAAAEVAMHLTGQYPEWWEGKRFDRPISALAAGVTAQLVRDSMQKLMIGIPAKPLGHGTIPRDCIIGDPTAARSVTGAVDTVTVRHVSGGNSTLYFRAYEQGREKVQAMTLDLVWLDEEPDMDYYMEALTRTNVTQGPVFLTFTPLKGPTEVVNRFLREGHGSITRMTIYDALHYTDEQREAIIAGYPEYERGARVRGEPALGSGRIFPIAEERITVPAFPIPDHWAKLCGLDFGWNHPTAAVWLAHDRDTDTVYVYDCHRAKETMIPAHASAIRARGDWIPVAWPHDGYQVRDGMHGEQLAQQFRNEGVKMRPEHAQFAESPVVGERALSRISTEAGIQEMLTRMETGRFRVFDHLLDWLTEFRTYHRKDGLIVKLEDDLMSATRVGIMDLRYAITRPAVRRRKTEEDRLRYHWMLG